jgi:hypothetical protein
MPSFHLPHFNDIAILRSIEPNRFRTFLLRFDNYLRSQGFTIPSAAGEVLASFFGTSFNLFCIDS